MNHPTLTRALDLIALALIALMLAIAACIAWPVPALAADGTTVDFAPLINPVLDAMVMGIAALVGWAINHATILLKLKQDSEVRAYLEDAAYAGINLARAKAGDALAGKLTVDVKIALAAEVGEYLIARVPDALKRFGLTGDALKDYVLGRLGGDPLPLPAIVATAAP